jgi:hypothetical protein
MKDPNYPTEQPKNPIDDALVDRNADPAATADAGPNKRQGDALLDESPKSGKPLLEGSLEGERPRSDHSAPAS